MAVQESYLDTLKKAIDTGNISARARAAGNWFRSVINRTKGKFSDESPASLLSRQNTVSTALLGKMYFFTYNPKWKATLPYYDAFP